LSSARKCWWYSSASCHALGGKTGTSPSLPGDPRLPPPEEVERGVGGEGAHALHAWVGCEAANQLAVGDDRRVEVETERLGVRVRAGADALVRRWRPGRVPVAVAARVADAGAQDARDRVVLGLRQMESAEAKGGRLCAGMLLPACARRDVRHIVKPRSARHLRLAGARRLH